MKKIIQIVLAVVIVALGYYAVDMVYSSIYFQKQTDARKAVVIERIKDIRSAQRSFKQVNQRYTSSFDTLINFVLNDSLVMERKLVDEDDSVAMARLKAKKIKNIQKFKVAVIDTVFGEKKLTAEQVRNLRFIPFAAEGTEFIMDAGMFTTESKVIVPVFECKAPYKEFLADMDRQELINLINECKNVFEVYPGVKVGAMDAATNDAGNWE
ncbi:MAG: hypothetical protein J6R31_03640 [Rikenellaceae bacterium]|nr:hypothetical protein [Rikenellaceae bacterium]MBO5759117.1 hypothetical protein [Rikenellaceae bacterium]MBO7169086.1 hypothetical protein [Rikenellaceae bacterium]